MHRLEVLLLIESLALGGAQKTVYLLARGINRAVFHPTVVTFAGGMWTDRIRTLGVPVHELDGGRSHARRLVGLARAIRTCRPHIVHTFLLSDNIYGTPVARLARVPLVIASRRYDPDRSYPGLAHKVNRALWWWADAVMCNNARARDSVSPRLAARHVVIPNGVDVPVTFGDRAALRHRLGLPLDVPVVATVGRIVPAKNPQLFVRVAAEVLETRPDTHFVWVGGGPLQAELVGAARDRGLANRLIVTGEEPDGAALLDAADIFILTSDNEGMPNAVMEAMAAQLPCVVTAAAAGTDLVVDGETGYIRPVGQASDLAAAVVTLVDDVDARARLGANGRRRITQEFSADQMVRRTEELYLRLAAGRVGVPEPSFAAIPGNGARA